MKFSRMPPEDELDPDPSTINWSKPSLAVIAQGLSCGCVLFTAGPHLEAMMNDSGVSDLDLLGLDDAPGGISIWEGVSRLTHYHTPDANEYDSYLEGSFREPTEDEWIAIRRGECPWNNKDWLLVPKPVQAEPEPPQTTTCGRCGEKTGVPERHELYCQTREE